MLNCRNCEGKLNMVNSPSEVTVYSRMADRRNMSSSSDSSLNQSISLENSINKSLSFLRGNCRSSDKYLSCDESFSESRGLATDPDKSAEAQGAHQ